MPHLPFRSPHRRRVHLGAALLVWVIDGLAHVPLVQGRLFRFGDAWLWHACCRCGRGREPFMQQIESPYCGCCARRLGRYFEA
jgi:hypothetical protein